REGGRERRAPDGPRLRLAGRGADGALPVGELQAVLGRQLGERLAGRDTGPDVLRGLAVGDDDLPGAHALLALVRALVGEVVRLDLGVGDGDVAEHRVRPGLELELLAQVVAEGLVGEAHLPEAGEVGAVVAPAGEAVLLAVRVALAAHTRARDSRP